MEVHKLQGSSSRVAYLETALAILGQTGTLKALDFVREKMCAENGYTRHDGSHYYYHCTDVTLNLFNDGFRGDILTAALLHDAKEDIPGVTDELLSEMFNPTVALYVNILTKDPNIDYKAHPEEEEKYLRRCSELFETAAIKTYDRVHNIGTLADATLEKQLRQANRTESLHFPFWKRCRALYPRYSHIFHNAKSIVEPHIFRIRQHYEVVTSMTEEIKQLKEKVAELEAKNTLLKK